MKGRVKENSKNRIRELLGRRRWVALAVSLVLIFSLAMVYSQENDSDGSDASSDIDKYVTGSSSDSDGSAANGESAGTVKNLNDNSGSSTASSDSNSADTAAPNGAVSTPEGGGTDCLRELSGE